MQLLDMRGNRKYVGPLKTVKENEHILGSPEQRMKDQRTRFIKLWLPPILWAVLILVLSTVKPPEIIQRDYSLPWDKFMHFLVNVGSLGQPRDGDPRAAYAIYDLDENRIIFRRVEYDIEKTQEKIFDANLPHILALRLAMGK